MRRAAARAVGSCLLLASAVSGLVACTGEESSAPPSPSPPSATASSPDDEIDLSFGVFGSNDEIAAYTTMAKGFETVGEPADVTVSAWQSHDGLRRAVEQGKPLPDVFMVSRRDVQWFVENALTRPVDTLLDERGVDFGDSYSRAALEVFSSDNRLQCMPYGISPEVIYYNRALVDFDRMELRGLDVPGDQPRWNWDQFTAAADFAARPGRGTKGLAIDASLFGLAPWVYAGGGEVFDDDSDP